MKYNLCAFVGFYAFSCLSAQASTIPNNLAKTTGHLKPTIERQIIPLTKFVGVSPVLYDRFEQRTSLNMNQKSISFLENGSKTKTNDLVSSRSTKEHFDKQETIGKDTIKRQKKKTLTIGATLNYGELNTIKEKLYLKDFKYLTPANAAKQSTIHPEPNVWNWKNIEDFISFANKNNLIVRLHGPISPQASKWAKEDYRTAAELEQNMTEFATALAKKYNNEPTVKWMDVVNETILADGSWFGPKKGTDLWENPWLTMGLDEKGYPLYILKAFDIATKYATNVKLVYNQNSGMQPVMWDKLKETVLYLRSKGYRVDGIGWQAHILLSATTDALIENTDVELKKLSELIDWAHQNKLEFHVTELDYFIKDETKKETELVKQAAFYKKLIEVLQSKTNTGVVTLNMWDMGERKLKGEKGVFESIYDSNFKPTPAYQVIKNALKK